MTQKEELVGLIHRFIPGAWEKRKRMELADTLIKEGWCKPKQCKCVRTGNHTVRKVNDFFKCPRCGGLTPMEQLKKGVE